MSIRRVHLPLLSLALCGSALLGAACLGGGQTPPTPSPATTPVAAAASPVASPPVLPSLASPSPSPSPSPARASGPEQTHTVEAGETLGNIAQKFYGDASLWRRIYEANRSAIGDNPDAVKAGTELRIPPKE